MRIKKLTLAVVVVASAMRALTGSAEVKGATDGFDPLFSHGSALAGLCAKQQFKPLQTDKIVFTKVLEIDPLTPGFAILEGPVWVGDRLFMSHIGGSVDDRPNTANLVSLREGKLELVREGYGSNGLALDQTGAVVAARHSDGSITRIKDGKVIAQGYQNNRFNSPNDLVFSKQGHLYFTDPDWQAPKPRPQSAERAYHRAPSGKLTAFGATIEKPNGVTLSLDQRRLYLGGTNGLYRFSVSGNGQVVDKAERVQPEIITGGVDGMSLDCAGNLFVTADGKIHVLAAETDKLLATYELPGVTNIAFGGEDGTTIYATTLGERPQVWKAQSVIPGLPF